MNQSKNLTAYIDIDILIVLLFEEIRVKILKLTSLSDNLEGLTKYSFSNQKKILPVETSMGFR